MRQKMANWVGLLIILFLLPSLIFTLISGCKPSDPPAIQTPSTDNHVGMVMEVAGTLVKNNIEAMCWELIPESGGDSYLLKNPPVETRDKCGMCKFKTKMKIRVLKERVIAPRYEAEVVEVLYLKEEPCAH